jgi:hypothetical protein
MTTAEKLRRMQFVFSTIYFEKIVALKERLGVGTYVSVVERALDALEEKLEQKGRHK